MCIEDAAIARLTYANNTTVTNGLTKIYKPNPDRLGLIFSIRGIASNLATVIFGSTDGGDNGLQVVLTYDRSGTLSDFQVVQYAAFNYRDHGRIVMDGFAVVSSVGDVFVTEILAKPALAKIIARRMQEIQDAYPSVSLTQPSPA